MSPNLHPKRLYLLRKSFSIICIFREEFLPPLSSWRIIENTSSLPASSTFAMAAETFTPLKGHCTCRTITYEVLAPFLCTNCCHCTWCQRESGTAFVLNSIIENSNFHITSETKPVLIETPSASGDGQTTARCPNCYAALYHDGGTLVGALSILFWAFIWVELSIGE